MLLTAEFGEYHKSLYTVVKSGSYQERGGREENGEGGKMAAGTGGVRLVASDNLTPSLTPPHHPAPRI